MSREDMSREDMSGEDMSGESSTDGKKDEGPVIISVCQGTSGLSAGAREVFRAFEEAISDAGSNASIRTTGDRGLFRDVLVDVTVPGTERISYEEITLVKVPRIVREHVVGGTPVKEFAAGALYDEFFEGQRRNVLKNCGEIDPGSVPEYTERGGFRALKKVLAETEPAEVRRLIVDSGLRGRGGAGFPTGVKWGFAADGGEGKRYVICNADEGDPGAFMDRSVLEGDPLAVLEGMCIAGYAIGADEGFVYVRAEYPLALTRLKNAIAAAYDHGYLGSDILGSGFDLDIAVREGAGAFVCGEETALIRSVEGKRGEPSPRPPYPAVRGLFGKPTVINNVETLANIPGIVLNGAEWFRSLGTEGSPGTKVFALAGKAKNTGLVEVPMGSTLRQVVFGPGGGMRSRKRGFKAVQIGGPSGGCLPEGLLDTPVDYESLTDAGAIMGSGGMIVMDEGNCMVDIAEFFLSFTVKESCGKCTPCRDGLKKMRGILKRIVEGKGVGSDLNELERLARLIKDTALCGLGNTAPNPVLTTLRYFRDEYRAHIEEKRCPAGVCTALLEFRVEEDVCAMCGRCAEVCPVDAVEWKRGSVARIAADQCVRCGSCIRACEFGAIR